MTILYDDADLKHVSSVKLYGNATTGKCSTDEKVSAVVSAAEIAFIERAFIAGKVLIVVDSKEVKPIAFASGTFTCVVPKASPSAVTDVVKDFALKTA